MYFITLVPKRYTCVYFYLMCLVHYYFRVLIMLHLRMKIYAHRHIKPFQLLFAA